jgi:hypothetical protein
MASKAEPMINWGLIGDALLQETNLEAKAKLRNFNLSVHNL